MTRKTRKIEKTTKIPDDPKGAKSEPVEHHHGLTDEDKRLLEWLAEMAVKKWMKEQGSGRE